MRNSSTARRCANDPFFDYENARFPIKGGLLQRRGGTVRHDAVAWGFARGADSRGVDIIQHCEVKGIKVENGKVVGVDTNKGFIRCKKLGLAAAGNTPETAADGRHPSFRWKATCSRPSCRKA